MESSPEEPIGQEEQADEKSCPADREIFQGWEMPPGDPHVKQAKRGESHEANPIPLPGKRKNYDNDGGGDEVDGKGGELPGERKVLIEYVEREEAEEQPVHNAPHPGRPVRHTFAGSDHAFSRLSDYSWKHDDGNWRKAQ